MTAMDDKPPTKSDIKHKGTENKGLKRQAELYVKNTKSGSDALNDQEWAQFVPQSGGSAIPPPPAPRARKSQSGVDRSQGQQASLQPDSQRLETRLGARGTSEATPARQPRADSIDNDAAPSPRDFKNSRESRLQPKPRARRSDARKFTQSHSSEPLALDPIRSLDSESDVPQPDFGNDGAEVSELDRLQRAALNQDVRVKAQLIAADVRQGSQSMPQPTVSPATEVTEFPIGLRIGMTAAILLFCITWVIMPMRDEMTSRAESHQVKILLDLEATRFVEAMGKRRFQAAVHSRDQRTLLEAFERFRPLALERLRSAGYRIRNNAFLARQDFDRAGLVLGVVLDEGEGNLTVWSATHGQPFGRPIPDASYEAVSELYSDDIDAATWIVSGTVFFLWVLPFIAAMLTRKQSTASH